MTEPTTAAGRALLAAPWMLLPGQPLMGDQITAIEAEAVAAAMASLREEVDGLLTRGEWDSGRAVLTKFLARDAVLAAIDRAAKP
jgi:hypothetical protein